MVNIHARQIISAPSEPIFAMLSDHEGYRRFPNFIWSRLVRQGAPDPRGVGARRVMWFRGTRVVEDIIEYEPPVRLAYRVVSCMIPLKHERGVVELTATPQGTEVSWKTSFEVDVPWIGELIEKLTGPGLTTAIGEILRYVKREVETKHAPAVMAPATS
jgi:hypothetical protein